MAHGACARRRESLSGTERGNRLPPLRRARPHHRQGMAGTTNRVAPTQHSTPSANRAAQLRSRARGPRLPSFRTLVRAPEDAPGRPAVTRACFRRCAPGLWAGSSWWGRRTRCRARSFLPLPDSDRRPALIVWRLRGWRRACIWRRCARRRCRAASPRGTGGAAPV